MVYGCITDKQKRTDRTLFLFTIEALKDDPQLCELLQDRLKIHLAVLLHTGAIVPFSSLQLPGIDYDIKNSKIVYTRDLDAFTARVDELLEWRESGASKVDMAPYVALVQSSGTGKTK